MSFSDLGNISGSEKPLYLKGPMPWPLGGPLPPQTPEPIASGSSRGLVAKSCPTLVTPWTVALQAPLSMGFFRQECWSGLPFPSPGDVPDPGSKPMSPALAGGFFNTEPPGKKSCYPSL